MRAYEIRSPDGIDALALAERDSPAPGPGEVRVRVRASAVNYRDLAVEVGGAGTLERSVASTRVAGRIALIGVLTGGETNPMMIMRKSIRLQGIYIGSRAMFTRMNRAIAAHRLEPVVDERFSFEDARAAYHTMRAAGHFGKLVVEV